MAKIDNKWIKTLADLGGAGNESQLVSTEKIYDPTVQKQLSQAIEDGDFAGGINYITDKNAEAGVGDWVAYADTAQETPVDGTGGSPTVSIIASATGPLRGLQSFSMDKSASNLQGEGVSINFSIDTADQGQLAEVSFDYELENNYNDDALKVFIYDRTNSKLINVSEPSIANVSPYGKFRGFFTFSGSSTSYRLIIHVASTDTDAYALKFDNVRVGPALAQKNGFKKIESAQYVTGAGHGSTNTRIAYFSTQNYDNTGDIVTVDNSSTLGWSLTANKRCRVSMNFLGSTGTTDRIGISKNSTQLSTDVFSINTGDLLAYDIPASSPQPASCNINVVLEEGDVLRTHTNANIGTASGWSVTIDAESLSFDSNSSGRVVRVLAQGSTTGSVTAGTTPIGFTEIDDSHSAWNGNTFTAPESGLYQFNSSILLSGATGNGSVDIYINGSIDKAIMDMITEHNHSNGAACLALNKDDTVQLRMGTFSTSISNDTQRTWIDITKIGELPDVIQPNFKTVQTKFLSTNTSSSGDISNLQFDNLEVGVWYELKGQVKITSFDNSTTGVTYRSGSSGTGTIYGETALLATAGDQQVQANLPVNHVFNADSTTLYVNKFGSKIIDGDGTKKETFLQLIKRKDLTEVDIH